MMLNVECAKNDTKTYLKALLSESCHMDKFERGQFIPKNIYLEEVVNIAVIGIPPKAFEILESSEDNSSKLMNMINNMEMFWGVLEVTPQSKYLGKYHFITDIENEEKGMYFILPTMPLSTGFN
eukprot:scaffold20826_cov73-Attheya_sp.AAC.3